MSHDPVCPQTGGLFILSSQVIHASSGKSTYTFRAVAHVVCWADASSLMQAVGIVLLELTQLFAT